MDDSETERETESPGAPAPSKKKCLFDSSIVGKVRVIVSYYCNDLQLYSTNLLTILNRLSSVSFAKYPYTVEPLSTDTRLMQTPGYYGHFCLSRRKAHIFSLKLTRLIQTPVNTDNRHFSVSRVTNSHTLSTPALHVLFICVLSIFNLSKGLYNIQFHLAEVQTESVNTKKSHKFFQMIPFSCFKKSRVILVQDFCK